MGKLFWVTLGVLLATSQAQTFLDSNTISPHVSVSDNSSSVFVTGNFSVKPFSPNVTKYSMPLPLLIVSPEEPGNYPVLLFIHGFAMSNSYYSQLFNHTASHGFIVVAPQMPWTVWKLFSLSQQDEIDNAACVANWMPQYLQVVLQKYVPGVEGDLDKLAISGHSRGGKSAFALALGFSNKKLDVTFSALIGVDPVAGVLWEIDPRLLTNQSNSFNLSIPITVIGSGLGDQGYDPCTPDGLNHREFYKECKKSSHFVITKYGHLQMLNDDDAPWFTKIICAYCSESNDKMIKTVGGIMVAFLDKAYCIDDGGQYDGLLNGRLPFPTDVAVDNKEGKRQSYNPGFAASHAQA